jgi:hypothetical protein
LTFVLNNLNRSMGLQDAYPFVLPPPAVDKLRFIHELIGAHSRQPRGSRLIASCLAFCAALGLL